MDTWLTGVQSGVTALEGNPAAFIKTENPAPRETLTLVREDVHGNTAYEKEMEKQKCPPAEGRTKCGVKIQWDTAAQQEK